MRNRCDDQRAGWTLRGLSNVKIMFLYFYSFSRWLCLRSTNWWCLSLNYKSYFSFLWMKIEPSAPYRVIRKSQYPSWLCVCVCVPRSACPACVDRAGGSFRLFYWIHNSEHTNQPRTPTDQSEPERAHRRTNRAYCVLRRAGYED